MEEPVITLGVNKYNHLVERARRNMDKDRNVWEIVLNLLKVYGRERDFVLNDVLEKHYKLGETPEVCQIKGDSRREEAVQMVKSRLEKVNDDSINGNVNHVLAYQDEIDFLEKLLQVL